MNFNYLQNKKILVTGHTGFKGSWLSKILSRYDANLYGLSLSQDVEKDKKLYRFLNVHNLLCGEYFFDISNTSLNSNLKTIINNISPDIVFHLAAQPLVRRSYLDSLYTFNVNAIGTANLLECFKKYEKPCQIICITTDKVYENNEHGVPFVETDKLGGYDPYSASKAAAEIIIDSYRKSFFNPVNYNVKHKIQLASVRAGNVIGGGDFSEDRIIPDIVRSIENHNAVEIRNPNAIRPWQHVLEPLFGYISLACKMCQNFDIRWSSAWNFGPEENSFKDVKYIVKKAQEKLGLNWKDMSNKDNLHEAQVLKLNIEKAKNELNWTPKLGIEKTLAWTFDWYKAYLDKKDLIDITERQINEYENM